MIKDEITGKKAEQVAVQSMRITDLKLGMCMNILKTSVTQEIRAEEVIESQILRFSFNPIVPRFGYSLK